MALVLAIEPDVRQRRILEHIVRDRVGAELVVVDSREAAVAAIDRQIPDVVLVTALLSPRDEEEVVAHLRGLAGADHLQTHTIPLLSDGPAVDRQGRDAGLFGRLRRKKEPGGGGGCDPEMFAEEISTFLARAAEVKSEGVPLLAVGADPAREHHRHDEPRGTPADAVVTVERGAAVDDATSTWSSPFEWKSSYGSTTPARPGAATLTLEHSGAAMNDPGGGASGQARAVPSERGLAPVHAMEGNPEDRRPGAGPSVSQERSDREEQLRQAAEAQAHELRREAEEHRREAEHLRREAEASAERALLESRRREQAEADRAAAERRREEHVRSLEAEVVAAAARAREEERARVYAEAATAAAVERAREEERARLDDAARRAAEVARAEERRRVEAETAAAAAEHAREEERARLQALAASAAEEARQEERRRLEAETAVIAARLREETRARSAAEAAHAAERARATERTRLEAAAAEAAEQARREERRRMEADAALAAVRAREEERARLAVAAAAAVEHAREEERARLVALALEAAERARMEERQRLAAEIAAAEARARQEERTHAATAAVAAARHAQREERPRAAGDEAGVDGAIVRADPARKGTSARDEDGAPLRHAPPARLIVNGCGTPRPSDTTVGRGKADPLFAQFRQDQDAVVPPAFTHMPVSEWARTDAWHPVRQVERKDPGAPDDLRELIAGLRLPLQVAAISYAQGCRIRRVRVPQRNAAARSGESTGDRTLILSRRTLQELRGSHAG